ncbi:CDP-alcohol phosphatidyltransferase family protein [Chthonobacter albigriseus]|uniref:CDP-alcohol phosphatidyltransferase family protein n=1 Tax=Chthonobacter albigriseus TaxID=1683161 RepID=UPI0015EFA0A7|nr:CDP-alcohol phosphatidyltransferase family protein [Chthonobacter albigriseus]
MFDARIRPLIDPPLDRIGLSLAARGWTADQVTIVGFGVGVLAAGAIALGWFLAAFLLIGLNRLADGVDGAIARAVGRTDRGGFLDISLDFTFYGLVPLGFAVVDPPANGLPAALLLAAFYINGAAFLAFAALAEKRGLKTEAQGRKSLYYLAGIAEGAETIAVFAAMCLFPTWFPALAVGFAALTAASAAARIIAGASALR